VYTELLYVSFWSNGEKLRINTDMYQFKQQCAAKQKTVFKLTMLMCLLS